MPSLWDHLTSAPASTGGNFLLLSPVGLRSRLRSDLTCSPNGDSGQAEAQVGAAVRRRVLADVRRPAKGGAVAPAAAADHPVSRGFYPQAVKLGDRWVLLDVVYDRTRDAPLSDVQFTPLTLN